MTSTWPMTDPLHDPWFIPALLKRKHSNSSDEDVARDPGNERKRPWCDSIERRMARMYIETRPVEQIDAGLAYSQGLHAAPMSVAQSTASYTSCTYTAGSISPVSQNTFLPQYAVEEPVVLSYVENTDGSNGNNRGLKRKECSDPLLGDNFELIGRTQEERNGTDEGNAGIGPDSSLTSISENEGAAPGNGRSLRNTSAWKRTMAAPASQQQDDAIDGRAPAKRIRAMPTDVAA